MLEQAWLIPILPFAAFFAIVFFGKRTLGRGAGISILAIAAAFVISVLVFFEVIGGEEIEREWFLFQAGSFGLGVGMAVDGLAAVMFLVVTIVSLLVQVYSVGYMHGDKRYTWYFAALSLFTGSMLTLVIAPNLFQLLVGWELVGICSYLLIGHWWEEKENSNAAIKAFITTKTGDIPFLFGIFVLTIAAGTTNISEISELAGAGEIGAGLLGVAALLLFGGAIGKSAQFPLHVWLPDAMAGPTPVSALIHAATMVAAGVYLVGRLFSVFAPAAAALQFVAAIGAVTMIIAALLAMVQDDIKRVLAYSTVSQLAYMMAALGLGPEGYTPGLFHLFTHAFFKALLFLGAGSVIHAVHSNNMSDMGGLRRHLPITFWTFLIGSAALAGIPPLAGFWSKDEIILEAFRTENFVVWGVALATAALTAFYMARAIALTFFGEYRGHERPHESPPIMTGPLVILAGLSIVAGFVGAPFVEGGFAEWVHFGEEAHHGTFSLGMAALSVGVALSGILVGARLYARRRERDPLLALGPLYTLLERKYFLDDLYLKGIVRPIQYSISAFINWTNQRLIDGVVNGAAWLTRRFGQGTDALDREVVDGTVNRLAIGTGWTGGLLKYVQSGNVQRYAILLFTGVSILAVVITRF
ncbi:MAG: NADH-quinone oxidoreductase subunit L [Actinomycetota bacterium]